jgi:uncharacterized membrane protein SirB2
MKLFTKLITDTLILFTGTTLIGLVIDMFFDSKTFQSWFNEFLEMRISLSLIVAFRVYIYLMLKKKRKHSATEL